MFLFKQTLKSYIFIVFVFLFLSCQEGKEHIAPAINPRDSVAVLISYGVNTLVSDSGLIKYRIVAERWEVNQEKKPSRWIFDKGLFLEQFDEKFHVEAYIQSDTAYYYDQSKIWELRGRVRVRTVEGMRFSSEELFWDQNSHELYSHKFSHLITPDREMQGTYFLSDEHLRHYTISNTDNDTILTAPDTVKAKKRLPTTPSAKTVHKEI